MGLIRVLCFSDTHLGFDSPTRARTARRRRGPEFQANFLRVLRAAGQERADCVIHCGDFFFRSRVRRALVCQMIQPLARLARSVPVFIVPGNHERSALPFPLLWKHPNLYVFDRPRRFRLQIREQLCTLSGFPFLGREVRRRFPDLLPSPEVSEPSGLHLLVLHELIEGARVGPHGRAFAAAPDVLSPAQVGNGYTAVLCGHIHRHQVLPGGPRTSPILLPGSTERTSFAEADETKGYLVLDFLWNGSAPARLAGWRFERLPTRPMVTLEIPSRLSTETVLWPWLRKRLQQLSPDSIVRLRAHSWPAGGLHGCLSAPVLRRLAPASMNVQLDGGNGKAFRQSDRAQFRSSRRLTDGMEPAG